MAFDHSITIELDFGIVGHDSLVKLFRIFRCHFAYVELWSRIQILLNRGADAPVVFLVVGVEFVVAFHDPDRFAVEVVLRLWRELPRIQSI